MLNYGDYDLKPPGGRFPGGPKGTDVQPAWLTPGEFVVPAKQAVANKDLLEAIKNSSGPLTGMKMPSLGQVGLGGEGFGVQYLASGGFVGPPTRAQDKAARRADREREKAKKEKDRADRRQAANDRKAKRDADKAEKKAEEDRGLLEPGKGILKGQAKAPRRFFRNLGLDDVEANKGSGGEFGALHASTGATTGLGEGFGKISQLAEKIPGPLGRVVEYTTKFAEVLLKSIDIMKNWSDDLHKFNIQFAEVSGAMAGVKARQDIRDIQLGIERGGRIATSAEYLATGKSELAKTTAPLEDSWQRIKNDVAGVLDRVLSGTIGKYGLEPLGRMINAVLDLLEGGGSAGEGENTALPGESADLHTQKYGRPRHMQ